jgi:hypothetical protein
MADSKTLSKYLKVRALAREGAPGERETAKRILEKMQAENPGIEAEAAAFEEAENVEAEPTSDPFSTGNWEQLFRVNAQYGAALAMRVESYTRTTQAGRILVALRMDPDVFWEAHELNEAQQELFRQELHEMLDERLDDLFED